MLEFTCNLCGGKNRCAQGDLDRERPSCSACGSSVRTRGLVHALSMELFGAGLALADFPRVKNIRGLGTSDGAQYASTLAARFDYRNTFFDREPRFDLTQAPDGDTGKYDFLLSSEVLEHVRPPAGAAFANAFRLLQPHGVLVFTAPYSVEGTMAEHFPELHEFGLTRVGDTVVLVNRTREGRMQVFENLVFHCDGAGAPLEMREFNETGLKELLAAAGFCEVRVYSEDFPQFGIVHTESWSLPIAARKEQFGLRPEGAREVVEQYRDARQKLDLEMKRLCASWWFRAGRKLRLL